MTHTQLTRRVVRADRVPAGQDPCFEFQLEEHHEILRFTVTHEGRPERKTVDWIAELWVLHRFPDPDEHPAGSWEPEP